MVSSVTICAILCGLASAYASLEMDPSTMSLGPAFTSSRVVTLSELPEEDRDAFMKFFIEQKVSFFHDADGSYVANIRMYDPNVVDLAPKVLLKEEQCTYSLA